MTKSITIERGEAVSWSQSPAGIAQVDELLRTHVVLGWYDRHRWRTQRIPAWVFDLARRQALLGNLQNPFGRGVRPRSKVFNVEVKHGDGVLAG